MGRGKGAEQPSNPVPFIHVLCVWEAGGTEKGEDQCSVTQLASGGKALGTMTGLLASVLVGDQALSR